MSPFLPGLQKPVRMAVVTFLVLASLMVVSAIFVKDVEPLHFIGFGVLYSASLAFVSVGLLLAARRVRIWAVASVVLPILALLSLFLAAKIFPGRIVTHWAGSRVAVKALLYVCIGCVVLFFGAGASGWIKWGRRASDDAGSSLG